MTRRADPRTARLPVPAGELPAFTPVPRRCARHDGWTPDRQRAFIEALADTGSVAAACKAVDMSTVGAYHLRRQPGAESFRAAWAAALELGVSRLEDVAMERALHGVEEPFYVYGQHVGTRTRYNDRLLMFMLRNRSPERYGVGVNGRPGAGGLNVVSQTALERHKKTWRKEWEAEQRAVSVAEVRESIDRKIAELRTRIDAERAATWEQLSDDTRAAWARFVALRERDLAALEPDGAAREAAEVEWDDEPDAFERPAPPALPAPAARGEAAQEEIPKPPPGWRKRKEPPPPPKTRWSLKDEGGFDP